MRVKWVNPQPLIEDGVQGLVKAYIQENCNFGIWLKIVEQIDGSDQMSGTDQRNGTIHPKRGKQIDADKMRSRKLHRTRLLMYAITKSTRKILPTGQI
jgi:hypothetical protein